MRQYKGHRWTEEKLIKMLKMWAEDESVLSIAENI